MPDETSPEITALTDQIKILTDQLKQLQKTDGTDDTDYFLEYVKECKLTNGSK